MPRNLILLITLVFAAILFTTLAPAQQTLDEFSGRLVDANCTNRNGGPHACDPGANTSAFGIVIDGKAFHFDKAGNAKAWTAVRQAERLHAADPNYPYSKPVTVSVTGRRAGNEIVVTRLQIQ